MKNNKFLSVIIVVASALLTSCTRTVPSLFGNIPSIYENQIFSVAKKAHEANEQNGIGAGNEIILREAPLAYDSASVLALPVADKMIGKVVETTIDSILHFTLISPAKISGVTLPTFDTPRATPLSVTLDFEFKDAEDVARIYYFLCSDSDTIHGSFIDVLPVQDGNMHVSADIQAPNIPAEYQEKISVFRIVSEHTYGHHKLNVDEKQKQWRQEYNERLNGKKKSALPIKTD